MTKKRRTAPWLLLMLTALALATGAVSCGGDDDGDGGGGGDKISVALVTDTGGVDDRGFNEFSINGLEKAETDLDIEKRIYISQSADDYLPNLTAAAEDGHDLVIAVGFLLAPAAIETATKFPDVSFAGVDHYYGKEGEDTGCEDAGTCAVPNALGMQYPSEESGYLAGVVAALMTKTGTVSTVGGKKIPPVDNWIAGYQQAVKDTKPGTKLLNSYSDNFDDLAACKEIALNQIEQGSDVVFQVAGKCGLGALDAACEKNVTAIGVDVDQSSQGPCVVTSALKPLESSVFALIETFKNGEFQGGTNAFYGVADLPDAELLTDFQGEVPENVQTAVDEAEKKLKAGSIDPPAELK